ncbi:hypothetical protein [Asaia bogorensis]|uniref:hypothetical protein n=1 Tax=Asaia bogorensis TaxID=91915 RepID=UPI0013CF3AB0|nr:hypothetical protein [Asaia bogorensis]
MNETRRIALEFALRFGPHESHALIRVARMIEAFLTDDDESLKHIFNPEVEPTEARP